jgi:hypothetical protein
MRAYASEKERLSDEEHAHIIRCQPCQALLGQCLAESSLNDPPEDQSK